MDSAHGARLGAALVNGCHRDGAGVAGVLVSSSDASHALRCSCLAARHVPRLWLTSISTRSSKKHSSPCGDWFITDDKGNRKPARPSDDVVKDAAVSYEEHRFPHLARVVTTPVFAGRPHFTSRAEPGYDAVTGNLYIPPRGLDVPSVADKPTERQAKAAVIDLLDYLVRVPIRQRRRRRTPSR